MSVFGYRAKEVAELQGWGQAWRCLVSLTTPFGSYPFFSSRVPRTNSAGNQATLFESTECRLSSRHRGVSVRQPLITRQRYNRGRGRDVANVTFGYTCGHTFSPGSMRLRDRGRIPFSSWHPTLLAICCKTTARTCPNLIEDNNN